MSLGKKLLLLLISLIILLVYSVSTFNYKTILNDRQTESSSFSNEDYMFGEYADLIVEKATALKNTVLEKIGLDLKSRIIKNKEPINLELIKENGIVLMNGTFKDEEQVKSIVDLLNINRNGEYKFEENRVKDIAFLNKLSLLMDSFKEFFTDGSKLLIQDGKVLLKGKLKDSNFKPLLDSIIAKSHLNIITEIEEPVISRTDEIIEGIKNIEDSLNNVENKVEISSESEDKLNKLENTITKVVQIKSKMVQEAQRSINNLTSNKRVTFKRRSTSITKDSKETVKEIANILLENSKLNVEIAGHTDSRGRSSLNKRISQDRANSVKNALIELGVDFKSIKAIGYGEDFPIAKDDANGLSEVNRRVEFIVGEKMIETASFIVINLLIAAIIGMIIGYLIGKNSGNTYKPSNNKKNQNETADLKSKSSVNPIFKKNSSVDNKPFILSVPRPSGKDTLIKIKGIDKKVERDLNKLGIFHFNQIASWSNKNCDWIEEFLLLPDCAKKNQWVEQAKILESGKETVYSQKIDNEEIDVS